MNLLARVSWGCADRCLGFASKRLYAVDMPGVLGEFIVVVKVLFQADVKQAKATNIIRPYMFKCREGAQWQSKKQEIQS